MFEHLTKDFFSEDLIRAHLQSEVGRGKLRDTMSEMLRELKQKNPNLAESIISAVNTAPSDDARYGFLSGAFYVLGLLEQKLSGEALGRRLG